MTEGFLVSPDCNEMLEFNRVYMLAGLHVGLLAGLLQWKPSCVPLVFIASESAWQLSVLPDC